MLFLILLNLPVVSTVGVSNQATRLLPSMRIEAQDTHNGLCIIMVLSSIYKHQVLHYNFAVKVVLIEILPPINPKRKTKHSKKQWGKKH